MSIVLNEREWAEVAIANRQLGKKPVETLSRVARYYCQSEKYKKREVRAKLEDFLLQCDPGVVLVKWADTIDKIVRAADKYPLIELEGIDITEAELQTVRNLEGKQLQRLAFTLLCVAKYWDATQPKNSGWVNTADKEIMKMANINTSIKRQSLMLHEMKNAGLLRFSKRVDSLNIQVKFIRTNSPVAIHISDFRNLGNQYLLYCGESYFQCAHCGLTIKKKSNVHKYCPECAAEMYVKKSVESVMRQRSTDEYMAPHKRLRRIWDGMKGRCYSQSNASFKNYGGRGIVVCQEWLNDFAAFESWALTAGYKDGYSIERVNVDGPYSPDNCTWIPLSKQCENKRNTLAVTFKGDTKRLVEWADIVGISYATLYQRIYDNGWDAEKAFTTPVSRSQN